MQIMAVPQAVGERGERGTDIVAPCKGNRNPNRKCIICTLGEKRQYSLWYNGSTVVAGCDMSRLLPVWGGSAGKAAPQDGVKTRRLFTFSQFLKPGAYDLYIGS